MPKKFKNKGIPEVHKDLKGFEIKINPFGELESNLNIDQINQFLNKQHDKDVEKENKNVSK